MLDTYEDIRDALVRKGQSVKNASVQARREFASQRGPATSGRADSFGDAVTGKRRFNYRVEQVRAPERRFNYRSEQVQAQRGGQPYSATPRRGPQPKQPTLDTSYKPIKTQFD